MVTRTEDRRTEGRARTAPHPFLVRLPEDLDAALRRRAAAEDRSLAATVRVALRRYLAGEEPAA